MNERWSWNVWLCIGWSCNGCNSLFAALTVIDYGLGMAVVGLGECFGTVHGFRIHDFFTVGSELGYCGDLVMGLCLGKWMVHM